MKLLVTAVLSVALLSGCNIATTSTIEASKTFPSENEVYNPHPSRYERHQDSIYNKRRNLPNLPRLPNQYSNSSSGYCYWKTEPVYGYRQGGRAGWTEKYVIESNRVRVCN